MSLAPTSTSNVSPILKPTVSWVHIDPDMARRMLSRNKINRTLRAEKVDTYARDMAAGRWTIDTNAICTDPDGYLLNGQHRLHAVIKSGATILFSVMRNVPRNAMKNMDTGAGRTPGDTLRFAGERNANILAAIVKQLVLIGDGRFYMDRQRQGVSRSELEAFVETHEQVRTSGDMATKYHTHIDAVPTAIGVAHYLIADVNGPELADHYLHALAYRTDIPAGSAIHAVDSRLRELRRNRVRMETRNYIFLLLKGWNYYATDRAVKKLQAAPKPGNAFRLPEVARWQR